MYVILRSESEREPKRTNNFGSELRPRDREQDRHGQTETETKTETEPGTETDRHTDNAREAEKQKEGKKIFAGSHKGRVLKRLQLVDLSLQAADGIGLLLPKQCWE